MIASPANIVDIIECILDKISLLTTPFSRFLLEHLFTFLARFFCFRSLFEASKNDRLSG